MRAMLAGILLLSGCWNGDGEGDKLRLLDRDFEVGPGASDGQGFVVYGEEKSWVEIHVAAPESGEGVDVAFLLNEKPVAHLSAEAVRGKRVIAGSTHGDAYEVKVRNRDPKNGVKVHIAVVRDLGK